MFLIMSMNGYVNIVIIFGVSLGCILSNIIIKMTKEYWCPH